jgi:mRNA interferase MazF
MVILQGDVYWVDLGEPKGRGLAYRHPYVVVQANSFNRSKIGTVVVCGLTSNLKRAEIPGNVLLKKGEAGLSKDSVVIVTQLYTVDRDSLSERIGALNVDRIDEIIKGIKTVIDAE